MPKTINFDRLKEGASADQKRWPSRDEKSQTLQMSVRMQSEVYDQFRETAAQHRYKHGELLEEMLAIYLELEAMGMNERRTPAQMFEVLKEARQTAKEPS